MCSTMFGCNLNSMRSKAIHQHEEFCSSPKWSDSERVGMPIQLHQPSRASKTMKSPILAIAVRLSLCNALKPACRPLALGFGGLANVSHRILSIAWGEQAHPLHLCSERRISPCFPSSESLIGSDSLPPRVCASLNPIHQTMARLKCQGDACEGKRLEPAYAESIATTSHS